MTNDEVRQILGMIQGNVSPDVLEAFRVQIEQLIDEELVELDNRSPGYRLTPKGLARLANTL